MLGRTRVLGFEQGLFYENTPTTSDITIDGASARSGNYGLHLTPQSGVKTALSITTNQPSSFGAMFARFYIKIVSLPSTARSILCVNGLTPGLSNPDLLLNPSGTISLRGNGTITATSTLAIPLNTWTRLELTLSSADKQIEVLLDGNVAIPYTLPSGSASTSLQNIAVGALDTVAAGFEYYLDDFAFDSRTWCGDGQVISRKVTGVLNDNANFTAVGAATKWQAISELPPDDDASYLNTGTVSSQAIDFTIEGFPSGATQVTGSTLYMRYRSDTTTGATLVPRPLFGAYDQGTNAGSFFASNTSYVTGYINFHESPLGPFQTQEIWNNYAIRVSTNNTTAGRFTALWMEVEYVTSVVSFDESTLLLATSFEDGKNDMLGGGPVNSSGTQDILSTRAKTGTYSLRLTHASGGRSNYGVGVAPSGWTNGREVNVSMWFYIETLPTSGSMGLFYHSSGFGSYDHVLVGADGSITTTANNIAGTATDAPAGTLTTGAWHHLAVKVRAPSNSISATDGLIQVYLDDVLVASRINCNIGVTSLNSAYASMGSATNVTGGGVVWYDDFIVDYSVRHTSKTKLAVLSPTGAGTITDATYTVVGAASKWQALAELPSDADTSYVLTPAATNVVESYAMADLPVAAAHIYALTQTIVAKRDGATTFTFNVGLLENGETTAVGNTNLASFGATASYTSLRTAYFNAPSLGAWTPTLVNGIESYLRTLGTNQARITSSSMTVAYTEATASTQVFQEITTTGLVQATNTKQITTDGIVQATRQQEVVGDGFITAASQREVETDGLVQETTTQEISSDAIIQATQTLGVVTSGVVFGPGVLEIDTDALVQITNTFEIETDGVVEGIDEYDVFTDGIVQATSIVEIIADGIVEQNNSLEIETDGIVRSTDIQQIETDGVIQSTEYIEIETDAIIQSTNVLDVTLDALVQETNLHEIETDGYVIHIWELEVETDGVVHASPELEVVTDGYCAGIDGILLATPFANRRINAIPFVLGSSAGGYINIVYPQPQERKANRNASKRIALLDLSVDGVLYQSLANGDSVTYSLYHQDGSQCQGSTQASWYIVYYDGINQPVYGWTDIITMPTFNEKLTIVWTININGLRDVIVDSIEVNS